MHLQSKSPPVLNLFYGLKAALASHGRKSAFYMVLHVY